MVPANDAASVRADRLPDMVPTLERAPVRLRPWSYGDAEVVMSVASDPLIPLVTTVPSHATVESARAYIDRQHQRLAQGVGYSFAIADLDTDEAVGSIGLWTTNIENGRATTGYWVASQFRRRGYLVAALATLTTWALGHKEVERLDLFVEPWNEGSWKAAESVGYEREGLLRSWEQVGEVRKDMYVYSALPSDSH